MKHLVFILCLLPAFAMAHSNMSATIPVNGAVLEQGPQVITFTFDKGIRLVSVDVDGASLDLSDLGGFEARIELTAPDLSSGKHEVTWRGLSEDGHPVKGAFSFTVK